MLRKVIRCLFVSCGASAACFSLSTVARAAVIPVPNGDFEDYTAVTGWSSVPSGYNFTDPPGSATSEVTHNDESWANPSSFGSGWQNNGTQGTNGKFGLDHPTASQHNRASSSDPIGVLTGSFNGYFIGSANMEDTDGDTASIQSGVIGQLAEGTYTLTVGVGARPTGSWNDVSYSISLVSGGLVAGDPSSHQFGTSGGSALGTPATATLIPSTATLGTDTEDLTYTFTVNPGDSLIGQDYAIRIDAANTGTKNGAASPTSTFTQANFDNVRLDGPEVPEPASLAVFGAGGLLVLRRRKRA